LLREFYQPSAHVEQADRRRKTAQQFEPPLSA